jgi:hypothetical protein
MHLKAGNVLAAMTDAHRLQENGSICLQPQGAAHLNAAFDGGLLAIDDGTVPLSPRLSTATANVLAIRAS